MIQQAELCRWLLKTDMRMTACFRVDMYQQGAFNEKGSTPLPGSASSRSGGGDEGTVCDRGDEVLNISPPHAMSDEEATEENAARSMCEDGFTVLEGPPQAPPPGEMSARFAADLSPECQLLLNAMQR